MHLVVWDKEMLSDSHNGRTDPSVNAILAADADSGAIFPLVAKSNFKKMCGYVYLSATFEGTGGPKIEPKKAEAAAAEAAAPPAAAAVEETWPPSSSAPVAAVAAPVAAAGQPMQQQQQQMAPVMPMGPPIQMQCSCPNCHIGNTYTNGAPAVQCYRCKHTFPIATYSGPGQPQQMQQQQQQPGGYNGNQQQQHQQQQYHPQQAGGNRLPYKNQGGGGPGVGTAVAVGGAAAVAGGAIYAHSQVRTALF
jgi:hypothetical protein